MVAKAPPPMTTRRRQAIAQKKTGAEAPARSNEGSSPDQNE
jgi:hypothetical protein